MRLINFSQVRAKKQMKACLYLMIALDAFGMASIYLGLVTMWTFVVFLVGSSALCLAALGFHFRSLKSTRDHQSPPTHSGVYLDPI